MKEAVVETRLEGLTPFRQGKVRDLYEAGDDLLIVATDRISAFDYILATGIPDKGAVLNQLSAFWFGLTADVVRNHVITTDAAEYPEPARRHAAILQGRSMLVRRTRPLAIECVVRGYLSGSGWKEYQKTGCVCGIGLPAGLTESDRLPRADLHAVDQGRERPRQQHHFERGRGDRRRGHGRAARIAT